MNEPDVLPILFSAFVTAVTVSPKVPFFNALMPTPLTAHRRRPQSPVVQSGPGGLVVHEHAGHRRLARVLRSGLGTPAVGEPPDK